MNSNTQMIQKGTISSVEGDTDRNDDKTKARVLPCTADGMVTRPLTIPWWLRGKMGNLKPGDEVAYVMFDLTVTTGSISVPAGDVVASGISHTSHTHTGVHGETSGPH